MMVFYFLAGLAASALLVLALLTLLAAALRNNWNHANRLRLSYLMPVLLAVAIVYFSVSQLIPRAFDLIHVAAGHYEYAELDLQAISMGRSSLISQGVTYYFKPGTFGQDARGRFQVMYTPGTRFIIQVTYLEDSGGS